MKKKMLTACVAIVAAIASTSGRAEQSSARSILSWDLALSQATNFADVIDWKVGEWQDHVVSFQFGQGTMRKEATSEEGDGLWVTNTVALMGQNMVEKILIDRRTGKILKIIINGEEQSVEEPNIEVLEQRQESVTVPAGTFKAMYVKVKMVAQGQETTSEMWVAPREVNMDGAVKMIADQGFLKLTVELKAFGTKSRL